MKATLSKAERLSSRKLIDRLFTRGSTEVQTFYLFPFRVLYLHEPADSPGSVRLPAILITVSKRQFKRAVDRNLIRRRIREAYRLNKALLVSPEAAGPRPAYLAFLYTAKQILSFDEIEKGMTLTLRKVTGDRQQP